MLAAHSPRGSGPLGRVHICSAVEQPLQLRRMRRSELPRLDLEAVQPIAPPQRLDQVAPDAQVSRLPLAQDVKVLVQYQVGIAPERRGGIAQQARRSSLRFQDGELIQPVTCARAEAELLQWLSQDHTSARRRGQHKISVEAGRPPQINPRLREGVLELDSSTPIARTDRLGCPDNRMDDTQSVAL